MTKMFVVRAGGGLIRTMFLTAIGAAPFSPMPRWRGIFQPGSGHASARSGVRGVVAHLHFLTSRYDVTLRLAASIRRSRRLDPWSEQQRGVQGRADSRQRSYRLHLGQGH